MAFLKKESAEMAIAEMNNKSICGREVRTNWATSRKLPVHFLTYWSFIDKFLQPPTVIDPHKVAQASSFSNTTVYVGGITKDVHTQQVLQASFSRFGTVEGKYSSLKRIFKLIFRSTNIWNFRFCENANASSCYNRDLWNERCLDQRMHCEMSLGKGWS